IAEFGGSLPCNGAPRQPTNLVPKAHVQRANEGPQVPDVGEFSCDESNRGHCFPIGGL
ncbi:hypothetical protein HDU98_004541, partial [Podochytrium sp. JEL0797]